MNSTQTPNIGDKITFKIDKNGENPIDISKLPPRRSISTYGMNPLEPKEGTKYIVTNVTNQIRYRKGSELFRYYNEIDENGTTSNVHLYVKPEGEYDIMTDEIFWYIDFTNKTICQNEDGAITETLSDISSVNISVSSESETDSETDSKINTEEEETDDEEFDCGCEEGERCEDCYDFEEDLTEAYYGACLSRNGGGYYGADYNFNDCDW